MGPYIHALKQGLLPYLTDFKKKDYEMRVDLMVAKVEEMTKSQDVHGLASIIFGGSKQRTQNYYVLFHGRGAALPDGDGEEEEAWDEGGVAC